MEIPKHSPSDHYGKLVLIYFLFLFGTLATGIAAFNSYNRWRIQNSGIARTGTVYEIEHVSNSDTDVLVFWVRFPYNGATYEMHNDNTTIDKRYQLQQSVKVMFFAEAPRPQSSPTQEKMATRFFY
ncbi:hypothetical protein KB206_00335 [Microvirga sp. STS02]|uniref:hypothetical protein n=1 Tax=Hymenobacter negativus TaxID=2795026 RepID=UPI0018DBF95E|nr:MULTISPECIES: hypothetical protein [Bacteria]MBH8567312.1 hypothetical protein [Hymenobacter negativus]MBR7207044.1 hypothetical protein [Microvirga sp. STS02]